MLSQLSFQSLGVGMEVGELEKERGSCQEKTALLILQDIEDEGGN
jgi:hypothetical protein